jgi:hypothetical protein
MKYRDAEVNYVASSLIEVTNNLCFSRGNQTGYCNLSRMMTNPWFSDTNIWNVVSLERFWCQKNNYIYIILYTCAHALYAHYTHTYTHTYVGHHHHHHHHHEDQWKLANHLTYLFRGGGGSFHDFSQFPSCKCFTRLNLDHFLNGFPYVFSTSFCIFTRG